MVIKKYKHRLDFSVWVELNRNTELNKKEYLQFVLKYNNLSKCI